jgi:multidrug transporter EmrE-like cation transporter
MTISQRGGLVIYLLMLAVIHMASNDGNLPLVIAFAILAGIGAVKFIDFGKPAK